mmetsp:Transcript_19133/g.48068  ORF Transcript_19133/g.48068 Transcript_19133/m.48068 type:complete len:310 (-) Transcript_19133:822-1751(-)
MQDHLEQLHAKALGLRSTALSNESTSRSPSTTCFHGGKTSRSPCPCPAPPRSLNAHSPVCCVPLGPVSPPATTRGASAAGVRRAWSSEEWAGGGDGRGRSAARAGRRKRARRLCLRQVRIGAVRVRSVRATLGTAAFGTQGVWHGKGQRCQGPAWVLPRAPLTCARVSSTLPLTPTLASDTASEAAGDERASASASVLVLPARAPVAWTPTSEPTSAERATLAAPLPFMVLRPKRAGSTPTSCDMSVAAGSAWLHGSGARTCAARSARTSSCSTARAWSLKKPDWPSSWLSVAILFMRAAVSPSGSKRA